MIVNPGLRRFGRKRNEIYRLFSAAGFILPLADAGAGAVNTTLTAGSGSPTFTRAGATATTILSTGLPSGVIGANVARSWYSPSGVYQGFLSEVASTNLVLRSEDFTQAWAAVGTPTNSAGAGVGAITTQIIGDDDATALEGYTQTITFTGNATKAISLFVKKGTSTSSVIQLTDTTAPADRLLAAITWSGSVPVVTMTTGTDLTGTPEQYGSSGFYRIRLLAASVTAANTNSLRIYPATDAALATANVGTIDCGGIQAENYTFPTSYIPTAAGTVVRAVDLLTYTLAGNADVTVGSAYAQLTTEWATAGVASCAVAFGTTTGVSPLGAPAGVSTQIRMGDGATNLDHTGLSDMRTGVRKRASSWGAAGMLITGDGATTTTAAFDGAMGNVGIGIGNGTGSSQPWNGGIQNVSIWTTQHTSNQLKEITT